jgi:quercetin dioxygenase-like cupin family protein
VARPGDELHNPATGQDIVFRKTSSETGGELLEVESRWSPGGVEPVEHYHPSQEEHFEVLAGTLGVRVGGEERTLGSGDTVVVPAGAPHAMWNAGADQARALWQTRPALRTETFFETVWELDSKPGLLQGAVLMNEYADEFRLVKPPWPVQRVLFGVLAPIGRALGRQAQPRSA